MRNNILLAVIVLLASCRFFSPSPNPTAPPTETTTAAPNLTTTIPSSHTTVDASTMEGKLLMGYQGWFSCPTDGSSTGWMHWFNDDIPDAAHFRVDMFPAADELTPTERCLTSMKYPNGDPAYLYSASNPTTVMRHFEWMSQYGIDGVFLQRFVPGLSEPNLFYQRNTVLDNVRVGAEGQGRVFAVEYALGDTHVNPALVSEVETDWKYLVDVKKVTESPAYLHHKGRPLLGIYGLGLNLYPYTPAQAMELIDFFENNPDTRYRVTLMGGVPRDWRTLSGASLTDPGWAKYYCSLDIISPWTVGAYSSDADVDQYKSMMLADMQKVAKCGAEYMPVVWPGTAFHNSGETAFNLIPRRGGKLYWRQVYDAVSIGVPMIFNAMFDEVDEDTAMYKIAATVNDQPSGVQLVSMDADGQELPGDWYLRLGGAATKMLGKEIPLTPQIPFDTNGSIVSTVAPSISTPQNQITIQIQITTTSGWSNLNLLSGGQVAGLDLVSASPEADINLGNQLPFGLSQPLSRAQSGNGVQMVVNMVLKDVHAGGVLEFEITRGNIGRTTVALMNASSTVPRIVKTVSWSGISGTTGINPFNFTVSTDLFLVAKP